MNNVSSINEVNLTIPQDSSLADKSGNIIKTIKSSTSENVSNILSRIGDTGYKVIDTIKENPKPYLIAAGIASLVAGIGIGRISKNQEVDDHSDTEILHIKICDKSYK